MKEGEKEEVRHCACASASRPRPSADASVRPAVRQRYAPVFRPEARCSESAAPRRSDTSFGDERRRTDDCALNSVYDLHMGAGILI